jgi:hypothetical protein
MRLPLITLSGLLLAIFICAPVLANPVVINNWEPPPVIYEKPEPPSPFMAFLSEGDRYFSGFGERAWAMVIIVFIEALIILAIAKIGFWPSLGLSLIMNLFSAAAGLIIRIPSFFLSGAWILIPLLLLVFLPLLLKKQMPTFIGLLAVGSIILGAFFLNLNMQIGYPGKIMYCMLFLLPVLLPFGLALLTEPVVAGYFLSGKKLWMSVFWANIFSYAVILNIALFFSPGMRGYDKYYRHHIIKKPGIAVPMAYERGRSGSGGTVYELDGYEWPE